MKERRYPSDHFGAQLTAKASFLLTPSPKGGKEEAGTYDDLRLFNASAISTAASME